MYEMTRQELHAIGTWECHSELIRVVRIPGDHILWDWLVQIQADQLGCVEATIYYDLAPAVPHEADQILLRPLQILFLCSFNHLHVSCIFHPVPHNFAIQACAGKL